MKTPRALFIFLTIIGAMSAAESTEKSHVSEADSVPPESVSPAPTVAPPTVPASASEPSLMPTTAEIVDRSPTDPAARKEWLRKKIADAPVTPQVFHPQGNYPKDKVTTHTLKNAPVSLCALVLSNYARKEVFVSTAVRAQIVPDIVAEGNPDQLANSIIDKLKEAGVSVVEVGPFTIALVEIPKNWAQPPVVIR